MQDLYNYPVVIEIPVAWGEMDAFQHVNNACYFRYFESARVKYFENLRMAEYIRQGHGWILAQTQARFLAPVTYPDTLSVGIRSLSLQGSRLNQEYVVWSHETSQVVARGEGLLVYFDYRSGKPRAIAEELLADMLTLEPDLKDKELS